MIPIPRFHRCSSVGCYYSTSEYVPGTLDPTQKCITCARTLPTLVSSIIVCLHCHCGGREWQPWKCLVHVLVQVITDYQMSMCDVCRGFRDLRDLANPETRVIWFFPLSSPCLFRKEVVNVCLSSGVEFAPRDLRDWQSVVGKGAMGLDGAVSVQRQHNTNTMNRYSLLQESLER